MLSLEAVQQLAIALAPSGRVERRSVSDAVGLVLAENLYAKRTQPAADLSAMDGYALAGDGPWQSVGESRAGALFAGTLQPGQCTRISTGAHMPQGSDRVLIQENAIVEEETVRLSNGEVMPEIGQHVRKRGFDFADGDMVLASSGEVVGAAQVALMLAAGIAQVDVHSPARVAILECGDELVSDVSQCGPHQIPATNGAMIEAILAQTGCKVIRSHPVQDDRDALVAAFEAHADTDLLMISGGASVGDHDHVRAALGDWGAALHAYKAAIKPGKPVMVGKRGELAVLGLPGNPVSSFVTAFLFALPMVRKVMGLHAVENMALQLPLREALPATSSRREFLRGRVVDGKVVRAGSQDSSALHALANANCLIDRPAQSAVGEAGDMVTVYPLQNGGIAGISRLAGA